MVDKISMRFSQRVSLVCADLKNQMPGCTYLGRLGPVIVLSLTLVFFLTSCSSPPAQKPNIVLIYTDDMNFEDLGIINENVLTPNIDALADQGMFLNRYYTSAPVCTPSRYGLLTGRYASRSETLLKRYDTSEPAFIRWNTHIEDCDLTIAHLLSAGEYTTGIVGKYHNLDNESFQANCSGLDPRGEEGRKCTERNYEMMVDTVRVTSGFDVLDRLYANNLHARGLPEELQYHNMEWVLEGATNFIKQNAEDPFFLYVATTIPHGPPPVESMKASDRITPAGYLDQTPNTSINRENIFNRVEEAGLQENVAVYTWLDKSVGELVQTLEEAGQLENTVIIFASDHSAVHGGRGKMTNYEGGVHTPAFIWWPSKIQAGETDALVANIDLGPTILEIAGVEKPNDYVADGMNIVPLLGGGKDKIRDSVFLEITYSRGVVTERYKYLATRFPERIQDRITNENYDKWNQEGVQASVDSLHGVMRSRYNAHELYPGYFDQNQLYDLVEDPDEQVNLSGKEEYAEIEEALRQELTNYLKQFPHSFGEFTSEKNN